MKRWLFFLLVLAFPVCAMADLTATEGFAIDLSSGGAGLDFTIAFDPTEITGGTTWDDGGEASVVWTWNLLAGDPSITFGNGVVNVSSGTLQQAGTAVSLAGHNHDASYQPLEATLTDIADGTILEDLVNTANPWADNEVANGLTITVADTADATCFVALWESATGDMTPKSDAGLTYDATTATLSATTFVGALTGNATTATTAATANAGDSATAFFSAGTIEHEYGGLEANVSAYNGFVYITAGATSAKTQNAGTDVTADLEEETHASEHAVSGDDTVFPADPGADRVLMWDDVPGVLVWTAAGTGDMTKAVYDADDDGLVTDLEAEAIAIDELSDVTIAGLADAHILIYQGTPTFSWVNVAMSADATISNTGAVTVGNDSHDHTGATISGVDISGDTNLVAGTNCTLVDDTLNVDDAFLLNTGDSGTGVYDFGGATTFEIPNTAGDVALGAAGQIAVDSTNKQLAVHDGVEKAIPLVHSMQWHADLAGAWDIDHEWQLLDMDRGAGTFPNGIVITSWYVDCSVADPATELNANLYYCDALGNGAFPGANPVLVDVLDTTTGNSNETNMALSDLGSGIIPTAKILYVLMDADPTDATTVWSIVINYYIPES